MIREIIFGQLQIMLIANVWIPFLEVFDELADLLAFVDVHEVDLPELVQSPASQVPTVYHDRDDAFVLFLGINDFTAGPFGADGVVGQHKENGLALVDALVDGVHEILADLDSIFVDPTIGVKPIGQKIAEWPDNLLVRSAIADENRFCRHVLA